MIGQIVQAAWGWPLCPGPDAVMKTSLSPKDLASAVGVSESSLKRWADDGKLRVTRTAGGHRRIPIQEAMRFAREARMPILRPDILGLPELAALNKIKADQAAEVTLHERLCAGDVLGAQAILIDQYLAGQSVAAICDGPIRSAMTQIGEAWNHGQEGIFIEHRATDICLQALSVLRSLITRPAEPGTMNPDDDTRPVALGGAPSSDPYLIPSLMCACVLSEVGFRTVNLGPDTPAAVLLKAMDVHRPRLVWLACSSQTATPTAGDLQALAKQVQAHHATLVVGGRVLAPVTFTGDHAPILCHTMSELEKYARGVASARDA
jgi:excisionase family DNA binding protein